MLRDRRRIPASLHSWCALLVTLLLACFLGMAHAADRHPLSEVPPPDIARIQAAGVLRVALTHADYPPFYAQGPNGLHGFDIDLARDIARRLGVKVQFNREAKSWDALIDVIATRRADVAISALSRSLKRAERVAYTKPYLTLSQALLVNRLNLAELPKEGTPLSRLDAPAVRIGTLRGSSYVSFAQARFPKAHVELYDRWTDGLKDLVAGRIDAVMFDALLCKRTLLADPKLALQLQFLKVDRPDPVAMAVNWRDRDLREWLNIYIDTIRGEGYLKTLEAKYIGPGVQYAQH